MKLASGVQHAVLVDKMQQCSVKKVCDSRRKQKWINTPTPVPVPPTPPRSPIIPEQYLEDLLELWVTGMDDPNHKLQDISMKSVLETLQCDDEGIEIGDENGDLESAPEDEDLLNRLFKHPPFDDSPPPTNPASPHEVTEPETEIHSDFDTDYSDLIHIKTESETIVPSYDENETDMELDNLGTYPKTECITSDFATHMFDNYFNMMTVDKEPPAILTEGDSTDSSETMPSIINYPSIREEVEIKHDCMWAGSCESDSHQDVFEELFGCSLAPRIENFYGEDDEEEFYDLTDPRSSTSTEAEEDAEVDLEEESNLEVLRSKILGDHSYAFNGYGPIHSQPQPNSHSNSQSATSSIFSSSAQAPHTISGIILKQEESSPKKTKIIVPLKDLMETLKQKSFLVAPLGPGKNVIRLTGSGETVKGVFDLGAKLKSASMSSSGGISISSSGSFSCANLSSAGKGNLISKKSSPKLKKAIHKPKQELSPCSPLSTSGRNSSTSHFNLQHSSSNSSSSNNTNSQHSSVNSSLSISSSSSPSSTNPSGKPRKAKTHNNMERMRRIDLRNSFDTLRKLVPVLSKANKCSKVEILKNATEYINGLKTLEKRILKEEYALKSKNESLRNKLALLTASAST